MGKTLKDIAEYYTNNREKWSYYSIDDIDDVIDLVEKLKDGDKALDFIKDYFSIGSKEQALAKIPQRLQKRTSGIRFIHTISTFLLGLKIAGCYGINVEFRNYHNMSFQYYWFLACLYHDIGYIYENDSSCKYLRMISVDGFEAIKKVCDIKYLNNSVFKTYSAEIVDIYLKCRARCVDGKCGVIDHGIVGGLLLYDALRKQFEKSWKYKKYGTRENFYITKNEKKLHLSNSHYEDYAKAADAIIAHNIWKNTLKKYLQEFPHINSNSIPEKIYCENELCYILSIADTIEPLKRNPDYLDQVEFDFSKKDSFKIKTSKEIYNDVYKEIKSLSDWVDVDVTVSCGDQSEITINKIKH